MKPSGSVADAPIVLDTGLSTPNVGDFLLMLPSNDIYDPTVLDCQLDNLVNDSSDI